MSNERMLSRYPRRRCQAEGGMDTAKGSKRDSLFCDDESSVMDESNSSPSSSSSTSDDLEEQEPTKIGRLRRSRTQNSVKLRRRSSRTNKFKESMAETRLNNIFAPASEVKINGTSGTRTSIGSRSSARLASVTLDDEIEQPNNLQRKSSLVEVSTVDKKDIYDRADNDDGLDSNSQPRDESEALSPASPAMSDTDESSTDDDDAEPLRVQRIIGSRSLRCREWKGICAPMNTVEVDAGSVWHQEDAKDDEMFEERFLVKWSDRSYLHCSWETAKDLKDQIDSAKTYLNTFFRKSEDGLLFTPEQRGDGEYFNPAFTNIDRILEVMATSEYTPGSPEEEDKLENDDLGIVTDKNDPEFEKGLGRKFFIKWCNLPYSEATYEWERDLILNNVEYKHHIKAFLGRIRKPTKSLSASRMRKCEATRRSLYKTFGDNSKVEDETRNAAVTEYQNSLSNHVFKNGGQLRDYQAEGVAWMISNYINNRSCILADEMGLGKTLQTAATLSIIANQIKHAATFLVVAPLSTISHWLREFVSWTDLNAIVYHGSAEDRQLIRELEMAYEDDRPKHAGANYLRRCKRKTKGFPWMVQVVITTPEMLVTEDAFELSEIDWDVLVVDEAHRIKNHSSKLAVTMRDNRFNFGFKILCTGTPIQNDMKELWTLLHFIDKESFESMDTFLEKFGDMKSKESVDDLHEILRPYILRRLKGDVEKSMPPKEETIIEVELTLSQKQYYRALFEKNVRFLHKGKSKAMDGPSLNNLAMQLRKVCNSVCLLKGIEEELRKQHPSVTESDFLLKGSGKLVLLDKLLPRLRDEGHRVLIFSQFKIMLDILEDFLEGRKMSFARIDGSITGLQRQQAIDRFQSKEESAPFIMMLSTRAGGVGINLTAADTVIIYDSDWNPQNDLQAQARCHRIGQLKPVKVYRLLSARTYEMHMFNLSSMKMGLDQAVLHGIENSSGDSALSKTEIEKLLKHGAYAIITEEKEGKSESASTEFVQQDIDSILQRRTRTIVHDEVKGENRSGGTFSKASFKVAKSPSKTGDSNDIDLDDPDFWQKMLGDSYHQSESAYLDPKQRRKAPLNYAENQAGSDKISSPVKSDVDSDEAYDSEDAEGDTDDESVERAQWGGLNSSHWTKDAVETLERFLYSFGYGNIGWDVAMKFVDLTSKGQLELKRMAWSLVLIVLLESAESDASAMEKRIQRNADKQREVAAPDPHDGGILGIQTVKGHNSLLSKAEMLDCAFQKLWSPNELWAQQVILDAVDFAREASARDTSDLARELSLPVVDNGNEERSIHEEFDKTVWYSLQNRGWKKTLVSDEGGSPCHGKILFSYRNETFDSIDTTVRQARIAHPELSHVLDNIINLLDGVERRSQVSRSKERDIHLSLTSQTLTAELARGFLRSYAPLQLLVDRAKSRSLVLSRRILVSIPLMSNAFSFIQKAQKPTYQSESKKQLSLLLASKHKVLPHPEWTARHDIVLLQAIYKHGFIELESNYKGILNDTSILWGPPFDSLPSQSPGAVAAGEAKFTELLCVAKRAELFVRNSTRLDEAKHISLDLIADHFCLEPDTSLSAVNVRPWKLNQALLLAKYGPLLGYSGIASAQLPSRKDLTKRAKVLLGSLVSLPPESDGTEPHQKLPKSYGFAILDLADVSNFLLAELLRSIPKPPVQNKEGKMLAKRLCTFAVEEAERRASDVRLFGGSLNFSEKQVKQKCENAYLIVKHIQLVEASLSSPPRLYKNVIRVILGESPIQGKSSSDALFPDRKPDGSEVSSADQRSYGDRAIQQAALKTPKLGDSVDCKNANSTLLFMTAVETAILSAACNYGLPVWKKEGDSENTESGMSWKAFGERIHQTASKGLSPEKPKASWEIACFEQILDYKAEPETLAKKTILMLAKLWKNVGVSAAGWKSEHGLSSKVCQWFSDQVVSWSTSLQLVDQANEPLALTAVDFLDDVTDEERADVRFVSCFDKQACRDLFGQTASVSKLRAVFLFNDRDSVPAMIQQAILNLDKRDVGWRGYLPPNWDYGADDELLLKRLLCTGIHNLPDDEIMIAGAPVRTHQFTQQLINLRVNLLVSEFRDFEEARSCGFDDVRIADMTPKSSRKMTRPSWGECYDGSSAEKKRKIEMEDNGASIISVAANQKTSFV